MDSDWLSVPSSSDEEKKSFESDSNDIVPLYSLSLLLWCGLDYATAFFIYRTILRIISLVIVVVIILDLNGP